MRRPSLFILFVAIASVAAPVPAEPATGSDVLELLEAALSAGEGVPARALLDRYLDEHGASSRTAELEILTSYYTGDYEAAANGVLALREDPRSPSDMGSFADVIIDTHETTRNYEVFRHENFEVRYAPGVDEVLVPYAIDTLKATAEALKEELGVEMLSPVRLEIYPDADSLARVSTLSVEAIRTSGTIALCKWGRLMIASPRALMHGYPWLDTIAHEYVHLLLTKATLDRAPVWLQEGVAKFLETRWREDRASLPDDPASRRLLLEELAGGCRLQGDDRRAARLRSASPVDRALADPEGRGLGLRAGLVLHRCLLRRSGLRGSSPGARERSQRRRCEESPRGRGRCPLEDTRRSMAGWACGGTASATSEAHASIPEQRSERTR